MIWIEITDGALRTKIDEKKPGWFQRAEQKAAAASASGRVDAGDGIWSEIKEVFILLQEFKCIYCETPMAKARSVTAAMVAVEYDVEHYRPKNRVTPWPAAADIERRPGLASYGQVASGSPSGYLHLAFDPRNYVVACKVCNSSYKSDRFPIAGTPDSRRVAVAALDVREKPLLLFPFGEHADDPGAFLDFLGPLIRPRSLPQPERLRAEVVVGFFELDTREGLLEGRCLMLEVLWSFLEEQSSPDAETRGRAEAFLAAVQEQNRFPHAACGRAFIDLHRCDHALAAACRNAARDYLVSKEPAVFGNLM